MAHTFEQRVVYERLQNGMDAYLLRGSSPDVVIAEFAFQGGTHATYDLPLIASFLSAMLPGSTKEHSRSALLESIDRAGAHVSVHTDDTHLLVSITCRKVVLSEVLRIVLEVLTRSTFPVREFTEAQVQVRTSLIHARENTKVRAQESLVHQLFSKGHPHWGPDIATLTKMLPKVSRAQVANFHREHLTTVGSTVCIVGDIDPDTTLSVLREVCAALPMHAPRENMPLHVDRVAEGNASPDTIISLRDKINVDTFLAIPTVLTRESAAYEALQLGVKVLGAGVSSRLFYALRTKHSLTYGAYASLRGLSDGYPGYLVASAIFPHDVFSRGLPMLREVAQTFVEKGVTAKEIATRREELRGKHAVGLSTTSGLSSALVSTVLSGRPVRYLDEYLDRIDMITVREVNQAISEYLSYDRAVTTAAGAIDQEGKPLA